MENTYVLLRVGEIFLKGKNRKLFENKLVKNIEKIVNVKVKRLRFRFIIEDFDDCNQLKRVFGLTSYSKAVKVVKDLEEVKKKVVELLKGKKGTFRVETKRSDKTFPLKSLEINAQVGEFIEKNSELEFSLRDFDHKVSIEINQEGIYLYFDTVKCFGGLPTGVGESVVLLVEDEASLLAGLLFMKRGSHIFPVSFEKKDVSLLQKYSPSGLKLKKVKDFEEVKEYAMEKGINVMVVGDNFDGMENRDVEMVVMKPLVGYSDKEIKEEFENYLGA